MLAILQNPWFIGIVGGIISGLIVFFITKYIFRRRDKQEIVHSINQANHEIINQLKPYITEIGLPEINVVEAIIHAVARTYNVSVDDLNPINIICEDLVKEINDNIFIDEQQKKQYMNNLILYSNTWKAILTKEQAITLSIAQNSIENKQIQNKYREYYADMMSSTLGLMMALLSAVVTIPKPNNIFNEPIHQILLMSLIVCLYIIAGIIFDLVVKIIKRNKGQKLTKGNKDRFKVTKNSKNK